MGMFEKIRLNENNPIIKQESEPLKNLTELFDKVYYLQSKVTHKSKFARTPENRAGRDRPLFNRYDRANLFKKLKLTPKENREEREKIIKEAHLLDEVNEKYFDQIEMSVDMPEYGEQKVRMADLLPPESLQTSENKTKPPIFFIPGLGNDIECVSALITQTALSGRRLVIASFPESFMGHATPGFADAVEKDSGFNPHVKLYKSIIEKTFGDNQELELWGYSTGATIIAEILNDKKYQDRTKNATLIMPVAVVEQSVSSIIAGTLKELKVFGKVSTAQLNFPTNTKEPREKEQAKLRKQIIGSLIKKVCKPICDWKSAKVKNGGNIIVITGGKDDMTKSSRIHDRFEKENAQMVSVDLPGIYHLTPPLEPQKIISKIFEIEEKQNESKV